MIHPHIVMAPTDARIGVGLFARRPLPRGTITWALDPLDIVLEATAERALGPAYQDALERHGWRDAQARRILCWDHGRFMNHGCWANSMSPGLPFEIAVDDIEAGAEVLCDYGALNLEAAFDCLCGREGCRRRIHPEDFDRLGHVWDARLRTAFARLDQVDQPLMGLLSDEVRGAVRAGLADPGAIPSVCAHRMLARAA